MLRLGLASYLAFVMAAGPWFCCCTTTQLANRLATLAKLSGSKKKPSCCSTCCHTSWPTKTKNHDQGQAPQKPSCPCREHPVKVIIPSTPLEYGKLSQSSFVSLDHVPLALCLSQVNQALAQATLSISTSSAFPHLTGQDILCALQVMRC